MIKEYLLKYDFEVGSPQLFVEIRFSSIVICMIVAFRMFLELSFDIVNLIHGNLSSANGTFLMLGHFVRDNATELILLLESLQKPIPVQAY